MPDAIIEVKLQPRASKNEIIGFKGNMLYIRVTAPPVDNEANLKCLELLSKHLDIPKSNIIIIKGKQTRYKIIKIEGISHKEINDKFLKVT